MNKQFKKLFSSFVQECKCLNVKGFHFIETKISKNTGWNVYASVSSKWSHEQYQTTSYSLILHSGINIFHANPNINDIRYLLSILTHPY